MLQNIDFTFVSSGTIYHNEVKQYKELRKNTTIHHPGS